jgi:3-oxoadipate enol-lactonase
MFTRIGDIDVHYTVQGSGDNKPWVTFAHSLGCDVSMWDEQAALLAKDYQVLSYDARGHGKTTATPGPYTLAQLGDDAFGLLSALGISRTHWIGISMGGMIGQTVALKHPGLFASMMLVDTTSRRPPNAEAMWGDRIKIAQSQGMQGLLQSTLSRWFTAPFIEKNPEIAGKIGQGILATSVDGFCGCCAAIAKVDTLDRLHEIDCPTVVMVGDQDHGTPPEMARQIHANLPNSEFVLIKDAAHISNIEQPKFFNKTMLEFLGRQN